ncbi:hypothetical protein PG989_012611 [Apiospora arundinis]
MAIQKVLKTEEEDSGLATVPQSRPLSSLRTPNSTLFGTRACKLVSGSIFRWSTPQTQVFRAFILQKYPNQLGCDLSLLFKALDLDGYEDMKTENGESVYQLMVVKVRRKISATVKLMEADGAFTKKSISSTTTERATVASKEALPSVDHQAGPRAQDHNTSSSMYDLPVAPSHNPLQQRTNATPVQSNTFSSEYYPDEDDSSTASSASHQSGGGYHHSGYRVRMPRSSTSTSSSTPFTAAASRQQQNPAPQLFRGASTTTPNQNGFHWGPDDLSHQKIKVEQQPILFGAPTPPFSFNFSPMPHGNSNGSGSGSGSGGGGGGGVGGVETQSLRGGGGRGSSTKKSARQGHIERMEETLTDFGEELAEALQESNESEEYETEIDSMKRLYDKLAQKLERLKLLPPA